MKIRKNTTFKYTIFSPYALFRNVEYGKIPKIAILGTFDTLGTQRYPYLPYSDHGPNVNIRHTQMNMHFRN